MAVKDEKAWQRFVNHSRMATDGNKDFKEKAAEALRFASGSQYPPEDVAALENQGKQDTTINLTHRVLQTVTGAEITNRYESRFVRRTIDDQGGNDIINGWYRYHRNKTGGIHEDSLAFKDCLTTGVGCTQTYIEFDKDPEGLICTKRIPLHEVQWDPSANQQNMADRAFNYRGRVYSEEEYKQRFDETGEITETYRGYGLEQEQAGYMQNSSIAWMYLPDPQGWMNFQADEVLVVEHEYKQLETARVFALPDGSLDYEFDDTWDNRRRKTLELLQHDIETAVVAERKMYRYWKEFLTGDFILERYPTPYRNFTYQFITAYEDNDEDMSQWFGLVKLMRDAQIWTNKLYSQIIHIIATNPKGGILVGPGVVDDIGRLKRDWARPDAVHQTNVPPGKDGNIMVTPQAQFPQTIFSMMDFSRSLVPETANVNMNLLGGQVDDIKRTSGNLFDSVVNRAASGLAEPFDSFKRYRSALGELYLDFMRAHASPMTTVRISGEPFAQYATLAQSGMFHKFDVVIDDAPVTSGSINEVFNTMMQHGGLEFMVNAGLMPPDMIPQIIPNIPQPMRDRWLEWIRQQLANPQPPQEG